MLNGDTLIGLTVGGAFLLAYAALVVTALLQVLRDDGISEWPRIAWIASLLLFPFVGSLVWLFLGHKTSGIGKNTSLPN